LLLRDTKNDYNCLHQDLCGEHVLLLQVAVFSQPRRDSPSVIISMTLHDQFKSKLLGIASTIGFPSDGGRSMI